MSLPYNDQSHLLNKKNPNCTLDVHQCHNQQNKDHNFGQIVIPSGDNFSNIFSILL